MHPGIGFPFFPKSHKHTHNASRLVPFSLLPHRGMQEIHTLAPSLPPLIAIEIERHICSTSFYDHFATNKHCSSVTNGRRKIKLDGCTTLHNSPTPLHTLPETGHGQQQETFPWNEASGRKLLKNFAREGSSSRASVPLLPLPPSSALLPRCGAS